MKTTTTSRPARSRVKPRPVPPQGWRLDLKNILVPLDFSAPSLEALESALPLLQAGQADFHLVHVIPPDYPLSSVATLPIIVSTAENRLWVRRGGKAIFQAVVSTGKGTTLEIAGRKMTFDTPTGLFHVLSKEENPVWVPPDWHYVEEARKRKLELVRAKPGDVIDAETGQPVTESSTGVWSLLDGGGAPRRVLKVGKDSIVEVGADGTAREVEPKEFLRTGKALVVPPLGFKQRRLEKTLGRYRLNLGDGYALHGTQATSQLGRSVSHGCVRLADDDLERLYQMTKVGDEVIIY